MVSLTEVKVDNHFKIIPPEYAKEFFRKIVSSYEKLYEMYETGDIPSLPSCYDIAMEYTEYDELMTFMDEVFVEQLCENNPLWPEHGSERWVDEKYDEQAQEILYENWTELHPRYMHDIKKAYNILGLVWIEEHPYERVINNPICEVW